MIDGSPLVEGDGPLFADGPTISVEAAVDASPAVLWRLITDIELPARFSAEFQGAHWLDGGTAALGARFVGRNANERIGEWTVTCMVIDCRPERCFGWAVGDPDRPTASWSPSPSRTLLRHRVRLGPGPSGLTAAIAGRPGSERRIVAARLAELRANMQSTVDGLAALAGSRPT